MEKGKIQNWKLPVSFIAIAFLVLFVSTVLAAEEDNILTSFRTVEWQALTLLALFTAFMMIAVAFVISRALQLPELEAWSRNEFYQAGAMVVIVFIIFVLVNVENRVFEAFGKTAPGTETSIFESSKEYLGAVRVYSGIVFTSTVLVNGITTAMLSEMDIAKLPRVGSYISAYVNWDDALEHLVDAIKDSLGIAASALAFSTGITVMQVFFLEFVEKTAFAVFLPVGILLRSVPFGRMIGSIMIALAVVFFLVYPMTFLMNQKIVDHLLIQEGAECTTDCWKDLTKHRFKDVGNDLIQGVVDTAQKKEDRSGFIDGVVKTGAAGLLIGAGGGAYGISGGAGVVGITGLMGLGYFLIHEAAFAFITFTILAILNVIITLGTARAIAQILGSDVDFGDLIQVL